MSSCVSAVLISLACDKHLSPRQLNILATQPALHYITWGLIWDPQNKGFHREDICFKPRRG